MKLWQRRLRGALTMGALWAATWFSAGILLARVPGVFSDVPFAILFAPLGFITGIAFSGLIVTQSRTRDVERMSLPRFAMLGAATGLLLAGALALGAALTSGVTRLEVFVLAPALALASAGCAAGTLALARRATQHTLGTTNAPSSALDHTDAEHRALP